MPPVTRSIPPPVTAFTSPGGRAFTLVEGTFVARFEGDTLWSETWEIQFEGKPAGKLFRSGSYGKGRTGEPRFHASTRSLYWKHAADAPIGIGFDVAAFDTPEQCCLAWGRSADQILDWEAGKPVPNIYDHKNGGVSRRKI